MSETTEILFNSPALHSLKRDQLIKLCKIHSIKANGKNVDLIQRLKQHALTLPKDDPLSIAARSEPDGITQKPLSASSDTSQDELDLPRHQMQRPSEQWEIVMESIQEVEETSSSQGTLSSLRTVGTVHSSGEFGTSGSKTSTVSSSIRALATSLGLKRTHKSNNSTVSSQASATTQQQLNDELTQHSIPYSALRPATPPINDNFTFDPATAPHTRMSFSSNGEPLPGCSLRPGEPAPPDARLSLGLGLGAPTTPTKQQPTTTIRLVSNKPSTATATTNSSQPDAFRTPKLKPFETTFDLVMSPSANGETTEGPAFWAPDARPGLFQSLYPTLTADDAPPTLSPSPIKSSVDKDKDGNVARSESTTRSTLAVPEPAPTATTPAEHATPDPFIFGSPLPQHSVSNTQFRAAATSVLEEMNKRLRLSGVEGLDTSIINKLQPGAHTQEQLTAENNQREIKPLPRSSNTGRGEITQKFDEAHRAEFAKMEGIDGVVKRKGASVSSNNGSGFDVPQPQPVVGKKRKSNVLGDANGAPRRPTTGPGAVGVAVGGRTSGTTRVISNGRRAKALPGAFGDDDDDEVSPVGEGGEFEGMEERGGKRARMDHGAGIDADANTTAANGNAKGKQKVDEDAMDVDNQDHESEEEEGKGNKRDREREAIKRKLEMSRAKRRSSAGGAVAAASTTRRASRVSGVRGPITPKPKPARFGFLTSAKNLVASVWNRGKTAQPAPATSGVHKQTTIAAATAASSRNELEAANVKSSPLKKKAGTPGFMPTKSSAAATTTTASSMANGSTNSRLSVAQPQTSSTARSRSPAPSSSSKPGTAASRVSSMRMDSVGGGSKVSRVSAATSSSSGGGVSSIGTRLSTASNGGVGSMGTRTHLGAGSFTTAGSRLLAPTASSLAKTKKLDTAATSSLNASPAVDATSPLGHQKKPSLLGPITNSPKVQGIPRRRAVTSPLSSSARPGSAIPLWSPKSPQNQNTIPGKIFSKPLVVNGVSGIPVLLPKKGEADGDKDVTMAEAGVGPEAGKPTVARQRTFTRKPRISRSKVIARLASQRAAASSASSSSSGISGPSFSGSGLALPATPLARPSAARPGLKPSGLHKRTRSSLGPRAGRASFAGPGTPGAGLGGGARGDKERSVLASAKKRVRQSEYARRRSKVSGIGVGGDD